MDAAGWATAHVVGVSMGGMESHLGPRAPGRTLLGQLHAIGRHSTASRLARLRVPTLLLRPGRDVLVRPTETDRLARVLPDARVLRFDDAGHGVTFQAAPALNQALLEHFAAAERAT